MSDKKTKSSGAKTLGYIRYGVGYFERLFRETSKQVKWIWKSGREAHTDVTAWHRRNFTAHPAWDYVYGAFVTLVAIFILLPSLFFFSILKSI